MSAVDIECVSKAFVGADGQSVEVIDRLSLSIEQGAFIALLGPNGCGKSTLLQLLAGLLTPDSGSITIDGKTPSKANVGFVFQNYRESLFPWMTNLDNISFSLPTTGNRRERRDRVRNFVQELGLEDVPLDRYPYQCSGGQQQLVALLRELICEPDLLLMDEPFASLDYDRRLTQYDRVVRSWLRTRPTVILVSHDIDEAIYLADQVLLLSKRPASVVSTFDVPLRRPRAVELLESDSFSALRRPLLRQYLDILRR